MSTSNKGSSLEEQKKSIVPVLLALTLATVNESLAGNMLMPFVGNLISTITGNPLEDSGFLSGILVASFHFGQGVSGTHWGRLGDRFGRRPVIFAGLGASIITQILFGFAPTIVLLCLTRFCQGLGNGNMATIKTVVAEISTKENEAMAFSFLTLAWGLGTVSGQAIGGLLYDPVNAWGLFANVKSGDGGFAALCKSLLLKFPALAPCLFAATYGLFSLLVLSRYLIETNKRILKENDDGTLVASRKSSTCCFGLFNNDGASCFCCCCGSSSNENNSGDHTSRITAVPHEVIVNNDRAKRRGTTLQNDDDDDDEGNEAKEMKRKDNNIEEGNISAFSQQGQADEEDVVLSNNLQDEIKRKQEQQKNPDDDADESFNDENPASPGDPHQRKPLKITLPTSSSKESLASSASDSILDETPQEDVDFGERMGFKGALSLLRLRVVMFSYMLLASHDIAYVECLPLLAILSTKTGGFDLSVAQIGLLNMALGITQIASNVVYPIAYRYTGKKIFPVSAAAVAFFNFATPFLHLLAGMPLTVFFPVIITLMVIRQLNISASYTTISIMLKDAAPRRYLGEIMGLTQSAASFVRLITPAVAAPFFAFSATHEWPLAKPFNVTLIFALCGVLSGISAVYTGRSMNMCNSCCGCCCCNKSNESHDVNNNNNHNNDSAVSNVENAVTVDGKNVRGKNKNNRTANANEGDDNCLIDEDAVNDVNRDSSPAMSSGIVSSSAQREVIVMPWEEDE